jgi:hypothetical protein
LAHEEVVCEADGAAGHEDLWDGCLGHVGRISVDSGA